MRELVEYIVKSIVDEPDEVAIDEIVADERTILKLQVAPDDMGKVIGKEGKVARSIRTLLKVASIKEGKRFILEIG